MSDVMQIQAGIHDFCFHYTFNEAGKHHINVNTFANSLVKLSELVQNIAQYTLPDYKIEITIDRAGESTFWTRFNLKGKNILTQIKEFLPTKDNTVPVLISLIALNQSGGQNVRIENNYVVINNNIKIDIEAYNTAIQLKEKPEIKDNIQKTFKSVANDSSIKAVSFAKDIESAQKHNFLISVKSDEFANFDATEHEHSIKYDVRESQEIVPVKVFLEKTHRKWEFIWDGRKISANITCDKFYNDLINGRISYNQKDKMIVTLKIKQQLDKTNNVYINDSYEIIFVKEYLKFEDQQKNLL